MSEEALGRYARLVRQYHGTLDLVSGSGLRDLPALIAEGERYAELIAEVAGPMATVVDLGSGAGLPGVVVAASLPTAFVHLVERRRRRGAFLAMAAARLGLSNVRVWTCDVQDVEGVCADAVTAQAVAGFADVAGLTRHLHRDPCYLLSRRGPGWESELAALDEALQVEADGGAAVAVAAERPLERDGTLVALRLAGGPACRPSA